MKRRYYGRFRKEQPMAASTADDSMNMGMGEPPVFKAMKAEEEEDEDGGDEEEAEAVMDGQGDANPEEIKNQQEDPIPMVISLLNQQHQQQQHQQQHQQRPNNIAKSHLHLINGKGVADREPRDKIFNSLLVREVGQHPALFDFTTEEYKSVEARSRHWNEVSQRVCQPLEVVRTRWKTLRDRFKKEVRRVQTNQPGIPWHHYEEMIYLLPFVRDKLDEIPYGNCKMEPGTAAGGGGTKSRPRNSSSVNMSQSAAVEHQQHQQQMCTAAILDLAMCAVNKFSPPSSASPPINNEMPMGTGGEHYGGGGNADLMNSFIGGTSSSSMGSGATAIINSSSRIRSFPPANTAVEQQQGQLQNGQLHNKGAADAGAGWEYGDEEDQLFCRIVLKKLGKLEERVKENAKAKIMEVLVEMQYGGGER